MDASEFEFIAALLRKHLNGELTDAEEKDWNRWLEESPANRDLVARLQDPGQLKADLKKYYQVNENILAKIRKQIPALKPADIQVRKRPAPLISFINNRFLKYAAILLLVVGLGTIVWLTRQKPSGSIAQTASVQNMIQPGTNRALLTLGNGSKIILDSSHQGIIAREEGTSITVTDNQVSYQGNNSDTSNTLNTMSTPRGGQYRLVLPDGTAIWLNAQSSITYPVRFSGNERKVSITGEVYFEVSKDPAHPFIVNIGTHTIVEVLGTHFNVNAYDDETDIHTTLMEGSVKIRNDNYTALLKPSQQASVHGTSAIAVIPVNEQEMSEVMAWKNGGFYFTEADINTIMRQLARWYDFDIVYAGEVKEKFHLDMKRNTRVENVFKILEATRGVHFKIEGKKIIVMP